MIQKKKLKNNNILLNLLFKSKNMYGESLHSINKEILPFIYGSRYNKTIINLKEVLIFLKRIFKLIKYISNKNKKILLIGNSSEIKFFFNKKFLEKHQNIICFNQAWVNGLITNKIKNTYFNRFLNILIKKNEIKLILIIKSSLNNNFLNKEITALKIPIISLLNTSQTLKNIQYPIITNLKSIQSIYSLMFLLRKRF